MQKTKELQWKVKHTSDFKNEQDFLETVLLDNGVSEDEITSFLRPTKKFVNDPFLMTNMADAVSMVHEHLKNNSKIFVKVDCDVDGFTSSATLIQFLQALKPDVEIEYMLNYEKKHGLTIDDLANYKKDEFGLIIIPDASMPCKDARLIKKNFSADIVVLDHHLVEKEYYDKLTGRWLDRETALKIYAEDKERVVCDIYTRYCIAVNCTDGAYPNPNLSGAGVVQKFIEAYISTYEQTEEIDPTLRERFLDLVSLGINADSMDLRSLEDRYYVLEGMKDRNCHNEFINELVIRQAENMKWGRYITSMAWQIAPKINGCIRYGTDEEQFDTFRAMLGVQEDRVYQPRRKNKDDPKPPEEIHSLQKTMARVCENIKSRQDTEVRKFVVDLDKQIQDNHLDNNTVIFVDGTKVLTKSTVTGLVANKLASKYFRPVVLLRAFNSTEYGGSMRGYDKGVIINTKEFLEAAGLTVFGHASAAGIRLPKAKLDEAIAKCNEMLPVDQLTTVYTVDWEIPAKDLKREYVQEVAENYAVFCSTVPEPIFAITNIEINASQIMGYGENNSFIRFVYNGIVFVKKYCAHDDFDNLTLKGRSSFGVNKKNLRLNIIGQFVLNAWEDKINPEVKIIAFDSTEIDEITDAPNETSVKVKTEKTSKIDALDALDDEDDWEKVKKPKKSIDDDLGFDW